MPLRTVSSHHRLSDAYHLISLDNTHTDEPSSSARLTRMVPSFDTPDVRPWRRRLRSSGTPQILASCDRLPCPVMDWKLELVAVPVSDVDRAKAFYTEQVGFIADQDNRVNDLRFVQLTPPGSACSIAIGVGVTEAAPGSVEGLQLVVDDAEAARAQLIERGVDASDVQDFPWGRFVFFSDPDGNRWAVQQLPPRE
jgi:predicted enzyme related to lactoylglutathione lyase